MEVRKSDRWLNKTDKQGPSHLGVPHSDEAKRKMSDSKKGKLLSELHKKKISDGNKGKTISKEHRRILSETMKEYQKGDRNNQFGTMWITDGTSNRKIKKDDVIPEGWRRGRIILWFNETRSK